MTLNPITGMAKRLFFLRHEKVALVIAGVLVGCCSGVAAASLNFAIEHLSELCTHAKHYWWVFILPGLGAALSSLFLNKIVREGAGHGVPELIYSVSRRGGLLRFRSSFSRLISSCLTIGSGGSAGPEAPVVMSGSAIGSNIAQRLGFPSRHRITLVGCGAAAAIASIFNAPIAGIVFTLEVVLGEWTAINVIPIGVAAVAGTHVGRLLQGNSIRFSHAHFNPGTWDIAASLGLALATALVSVALSRMIRHSGKIWAKLPSSRAARALLGGICVGLIGLGVPQILGEGYNQIYSLIHGQYSPGLLLLLAMLLLKMLATSLTLGSGGSGGIFAPGLVVGSFTGVAYFRLIGLLFGVQHLAPEGCYALLGMAGIIGGMLQAPLTGLFLVVDITSGYEVILPLIVVSLVSSSVCRYFESDSFYLKDLKAEGGLIRPGTDERVLEDLQVSEVLEQDVTYLHNHMSLADLVTQVKTSHRNHFPVLDQNTGDFLGMIDLAKVRPYLFNRELYGAVLVVDIMDPYPPAVSPEERLTEVLELMDHLQVFSLPVVAGKRFMGMISKGTLLDHYRRELIVQTTY